MTQFRMDEDFEEPKDSDPLMAQPGSSVPPEVFEMKAIMTRSLSKPGTTPVDSVDEPSQVNNHRLLIDH